MASAITSAHFNGTPLVVLGGRAAEEIVFGHGAVTTGAGNDIERATAIAPDRKDRRSFVHATQGSQVGLADRVEKAYDDYEFHVLYHAVHNFCSVEMSAFYLDVLGDPRGATGKALQELGGLARELRVLGSYPEGVKRTAAR